MSAVPPPLVALLGPTGGGKSEIATALAEGIGGEVVNCDAFQLYAGLAITTAQPEPALTGRVPHHGYGWLDPRERLGAGEYARLAEAWIAEVRGRGRIPILTGGTGFYFEALVRPLPETPRRDPAIDARLDRLAARADGPARLHRLLARLDPAAAARLAPNDRARVRRALAFRVQTGRPFSALRAGRDRPPHHEARAFFLDLPQSELAGRLEARARAMLAQGLADELAALRAAGVPADAPGLRAIGAAEGLALLAGELDAAGALAAIVRRSRQYAKRQRTWFRHSPDLREARNRVDLAGLAPRAAAACIADRLRGD